MALLRLMTICTFISWIVDAGAVPQVFPLMDDGLPIVHTNLGPIRGLRAEDGNYSMFMGIPYAEVDKDHPFGISRPYPLFEETFDAFDDSAICPQIEEFNQTVVGTLDCLNLNVYVPDSASTENPLPVMVWIFGGRFSLGFASRFVYGPEFIVRHDVILVTFNYRLGPYGFMCLDIPEVPGNQGLKDQTLALRWIKDNIAAFGGDDSRLTVSGNSAGGMSTDFHLYYGQEQLFHRIIPQSGNALVNSAIGESFPTTALELAEHFNYTTNDLSDALSFLATIDSHELIVGSNEAGLVFSPCVEKQFENVENFITRHPVNVRIERVKDIDVLIGFNNDEMYTAYSRLDNDELAIIDFVDNALNANFVFGEEQELARETKEVVTHFYFGDDDVTVDNVQQATDLSSDFSFNHPTLRSVKKYLDNGAENLYLYLFSYSGARNFLKDRVNITGGGAAHADELGYLFDISYMQKPLDSEDELIVDRITELWTNFVKYGNPTPAPTDLVPLLWPRVTRDTWHFLEINTELRLATRPKHSRMAFLDLLYNMNEEYQRGFERAPSSGRNVALDISLPVLFSVKYFL